MADFLGKTTQKARKEYNCDSCYWIKEAIANDGIRHIPFSDKRIIVDLIRRRKGKIKKGDTYERVSHVDEGTFFVSHNFPQAIELCQKYDLYPDWD